MFRLTPRFLPSLSLLSTRRLASSTSKIPHKDSLNPTSKESTRSGTNDEIAHDDAAYNSDTDPASQKAAAGKEVCSVISFPRLGGGVSAATSGVVWDDVDLNVNDVARAGVMLGGFWL
ncbi:hypothetical protein K440DRAFT_25287 [Wilcoxina mikolae CBS 423.85]|nr:hypothetical protein K440DRAFT_25287 [Wilcoxina mikolae CBS 423.85]